MSNSSLQFELPIKLYLPIRQVKSSIHQPKSKIHQPQPVRHYFIWTLKQKHHTFWSWIFYLLTSPSWLILISISIFPLTEPKPPNSANKNIRHNVILYKETLLGQACLMLSTAYVCYAATKQHFYLLKVMRRQLPS